MATQFDIRAASENALACIEVALENLRKLYPLTEANEWVAVPPIEAQNAIHELQHARSFTSRTVNDLKYAIDPGVDD